MKVLLTGATGFVGSHILDSLCIRGLDVVALVRATSSSHWIAPQLPKITLVEGSIDDPVSLQRALAGVTHVIHCAGATKALNRAGFFRANHLGTRHVVDAVNAHGGIARLLLISSLAAAGPARPGSPRQEADPPAPVSTYGRSKLAGEQEVSGRCQADYTILRPSAVYGPRDLEFLRFFQAVQRHLRPNVAGGRQELSLVFAKDLAETAVQCLTHPAAARQTYFVANAEVVTLRQLLLEIASHMSVRTVPVPVPGPVVWLGCLVQEILAQITRRPRVLSLQKFAELRQRAWSCSPAKLQRETGLVCRTTIFEGVPRAYEWYRWDYLL